MEIRALKARSSWPPVDPAVDLTDAPSVLNYIAARTRVAAIHLELDRPDICWKGRILGVDEGTVTFLELDTQAEWKRKPRLIDLDDITRLDFGGDYESRLDPLAEAPPSVYGADPAPNGSRQIRAACLPLGPENPEMRGKSRSQDLPGIERFRVRVATPRLAERERPTFGS